MISVVDDILRETLLFAAFGFLIGGVDDLAVDIAFGVRWLRRWCAGRGRAIALAELPVPKQSGRIAVFVAAWDEADVVGAMLETALARFEHRDYRIYVGTYPNDPATIAIVADVAARDSRVRLVIGSSDGPTTKSACLNTVWAALLREEAGSGNVARMIVLHDAEDVVHPAELRVFDALIGPHQLVQLPILPLVDRGSRLVSGHYCDEFAESHAKQLVVRQALGAGLPLAGVGCAIAREALDALAAARGDGPFDPASITEDYELGLAVSALGGSGLMARVREYRGGPLVAVRAYFPATLDAAVRQKSRWMLGIALAGWDRIGWGAWGDWREHWMRMRDRRAPLAVLVLAAAYIALVSWALAGLLHRATGTAPAPLPAPAWLLSLNAVLLGWRLAMRMVFTGLGYGWRESLWSIPRALVANLISLLAARRAMTRYVAMLHGRAVAWEKTAHHFPADMAVARSTE
ncbi:MAG: glycosyl transferase family protein [Sphingomonas sp.]